MFFYLVYSLPWGADLPSGKRNTRVFFFGWMLYTLTYILIQNLRLNGTLGIYADSIYTGFIIMAVGDIATMAYLYKYKYGRLIFHEMGEDLDGRWNFDDASGKYKLAKPDNLEQQQEQQVDANSNNQPT